MRLLTPTERNAMGLDYAEKLAIAVRALKATVRMHGMLIPSYRYKGEHRELVMQQLINMERQVFEALDICIGVEIELVDKIQEESNQ